MVSGVVSRVNKYFCKGSQITVDKRCQLWLTRLSYQEGEFMYLVIFEDRYVIKREKFTKDDLQPAEWGLTTLVDISDPSNPTVLREGGWAPIDVE
jgi:hypothetical protein